VTLRQLRYVLAVAELGSFTHAAERLHVSQPTLSQQVRALEAELGALLLHRPPCAVEPTAAGRALLADARVAVAAAERAARSVRAAMGREPARLQVAATPLLAAGALPACVRRWRAQDPERVLELRERPDGEAVAQALLDGEAELGIAPRPDAWDGALEPLGAVELVLVLAPDDPLARSRRPLAPTALGASGWVLLDEAHELTETLSRACVRAGVDPAAAVRVSEPGAAARLAAAGAGPALVPRTLVPGELLGACRPFDPPAAWEVVALARTPTWPPAARSFLDLLRECAQWRAAPRLRCAS